MEILLNSKKSVYSNNKENFVDVNIKQSTKPLLFTDFKKEVDLYELFEKERNECNNYRFVLTIKPYCTNVLFNPFTEIIKNEGSNDDITVVTDKNTISITGDIYGKTTDIDRSYMLQNTEYSKSEIGYEYKPGYDIFNNHILRNKTFKIVCNNNGRDREVFNTIEDNMRYANSNDVKYQKRNDISDALSTKETKHLYDKDDLYQFKDGSAINNNLIEDNGWFGFKNNSSIMSKDNNSFMYTSNVLNNKTVCEFIDMYPDRTLFSFNPKVNNFRKRLEHNWDIVLTYPYKNYYNSLVKLNECNGVKILKMSYHRGNSGERVIMFRTYIKHGLKSGDTICLYRNSESLSRYYRITNIGDLKQKNKDYYFYVNDINIFNEFNITFTDSNNNPLPEEDILNQIDGNINNNFDDIRYAKIINNIPCQYYFRLFKKIPNLTYKKENLSQNIVDNEELFEDYILENSSNDGNMLDFNKEVYQLSFSNTIYNDSITQHTFTDTVNLEFIKDNRGKPLTEIFFTFIKRNKGYDEWYNKHDYTSENVEFSHCFGRVTSGLYFHHEDYDDISIKEDLASMGDVRLLNNINIFNSKPLEVNLTEIGNALNDTNQRELDLYYVYGKTDGLFLGDVVEFNPVNFYENVLETVSHRFNTVQREYTYYTMNPSFKNFVYNEIDSDDYDLNGFSVSENMITDNETYKIGDNDISYLIRPEGYYYKAHYNCKIKELGALKQNSHYEQPLKKSEFKLENDIPTLYIKTKLPHHLLKNELILICDDENDLIYHAYVSSVIDKLNYTIIKIFDYKNKIDINIIEDISTKLNEGKYVIRRYNYEIPSYAERVAKNAYLWRDIQGIGNISNNDLQEYPYTNNSFYINKEINFYLHRQDNTKTIGLYSDIPFPQDVPGNVLLDSVYNYKEDTEIIC